MVTGLKFITTQFDFLENILLTHGVFFKIYINEMGGQKFKMAG
jgi:hypothetical protein